MKISLFLKDLYIFTNGGCSIAILNDTEVCIYVYIQVCILKKSVYIYINQIYIYLSISIDINGSSRIS